MRKFKLKDTLPKLFRIVSSKNARVADLWDGGGGGGLWEVQFRRSFQDWQVAQFLDVIYL